MEILPFSHNSTLVVMSFAVATTKTGFFFSCIQERRVARTRIEVPPSPEMGLRRYRAMPGADPALVERQLAESERENARAAR